MKVKKVVRVFVNFILDRIVECSEGGCGMSPEGREREHYELKQMKGKKSGGEANKGRLLDEDSLAIQAQFIYL